MEQLPDLYQITTPGLEAEQLQYWPCNGLSSALSKFEHAARWLTRSERTRARLEFIPGGNLDSPVTEPARIFRANIGGGVSEITDKER